MAWELMNTAKQLGTTGSDYRHE